MKIIGIGVVGCILIFMMVLSLSSWLEQSSISTWLWDTEKIAEEQTDILTFLDKENVDVLYLQISKSMDKELYRDFIAKATEQDLEVHALGGSKEWATKESEQEFQDYLQWIQLYQESAKKEERFTGIHLDVEPYLHKDWEKNQSAYVKQYQYVLAQTEETAKRLKLTFGADMPFWFDGVSYRNAYGSGLLSEWIIDHTDFVSIMSYRNKAKGKNGINMLVKSEINYAKKVGKTVNVGVEMHPSDEGDNVSFSNTKLSEFRKQLLLVQKTYGKSTGFNGFSIHSLESWMEKAN